MRAADDVLIALEGVAVGFGRPLLSGITARVRAGDYWGIFGPNGAGKTTLVKTVLGVLKPVAGTLDRRPGLRVGYVPQLSTLRDSLPLSVRQVVALGALDLKDLSPVEEVLSRLGIEGVADAPFSSLSGGQRQRVMVARALHRRPDVLVLDEPGNNVDLLTRHALMHLLRDLNRSGTAVLLVTHHLGEIGPEVNRILWLDAREGLCLAGSMEEVFTDPRLKAAYGGSLALVPGPSGPTLAWTCEEGEVARV
jgi:ABC-type Mn2+/Zn2+ transport system ATPase subunit